jgi:hypothetical protein
MSGSIQPSSDGKADSWPQARLVEMGDWIFMSWALQVAATLGVADQLADGPRDIDDLAFAVGANPAALYRVLRLLAMHGVVTEVAPRRFGLTELGEPLRTDLPGSLRSWFVMNAPIYRALMEAPLHSVLTGEPVFERVMGVPFFDYASVDPEWGEAFDNAMGEVGRQTAAAVVATYDFSAFGRVMDVGGGTGTLISAILRAHPHLHGVVFDQPHVVARAGEALAEAGLAGRSEVVAGDFFASIPPGVDACLLSWIIHDWDDERATLILRNCRAAVGERGRVLLIESVMPAGDEPHFAKTLDLAMLVALGGRERTEGEYRLLLAKAGLELKAVLPMDSPLTILEAVPI